MNYSSIQYFISKMPQIILHTLIKSDIQICFDLSRSIDLHKLSTAQTNETAISGKTSGLIGPNEFVTWQATHFGIKQKLTSKITAFDPPHHFRDEQLKGAFKFFIHDHYFEQKDNLVLMRDIFNFQSPFGLAGQLFDKIILTDYLRAFLIVRNNMIKEFAESDQWRLVLQEKSKGD